jgi:antitoxin PrlF
VDVAATVSSKGQVTIPKQVRDALGIKRGDHVVFRVEGDRAVLARTPNLLNLAGPVSVPAEKAGPHGTRSDERRDLLELKKRRAGHTVGLQRHQDEFVRRYERHRQTPHR